MGLHKVRLGELIEPYYEACNQPHLTVNDVSGINADKEFFEPSKQVGADTSKYQFVPPGYFACNLMHVGRDVVLPISMNRTDAQKIVSPAYSVFSIHKDVDVHPDYFFMMMKSKEMDRYFWFHTDGSVRDGMSWQDFCDTEISLPPRAVQQKYVAVYRAILANQQSYERGLEQLHLAAEANIEHLEESLEKQPLGDYIELSERYNDDGALGEKDVAGISIEKKFIDTKADLTHVNLRHYRVILPNEFAYVPVTSRNGGKISLARNESDQALLCSAVYTAFHVRNERELVPSYLSCLLERPEFDRYARFHSWGTAREMLDWDAFCALRVPVPDGRTQQALANLYTVYRKRRQLAERLQAQLAHLCPVLIRGAMDEAARG